MAQDFTEQRFDYTGGRPNAPELIVMVGVSASGKSTLAKEWARKSGGRMVRYNRDNMREMMYPGVPWNGNLENLVRDLEREAVRMALQRGKDVVVDDTNCVRQTRQKWEELAVDAKAKLRIVTMTTDIKECIARDKARGEVCPKCNRPAGVMVGEGVIRKQAKDLREMHASAPEKREVKLTRPYFERQQLIAGGFVPRLVGAPWVLVDVDGTVANHRDERGKEIRSPYDESRVLEDSPWTSVIEEVNRLWETHNICIVSGRHDHCGDDTCDWLEMHGVKFDHIIMRYSGDNRSDAIVKKEILDEIVAVVGRGNIACVIDDRPRVVEMWHNNGLNVRQVFHGEFLVNPTTVHAEGCRYAEEKGYRRCPDCGALEYF